MSQQLATAPTLVNPPDQPTAGLMIVNGETVTVTPATMKSIAGAGNVYTFSQNYTLPQGHQVITYSKGRPYTLDAVTKAALIAASAPMTAA